MPKLPLFNKDTHIQPRSKRRSFAPLTSRKSVLPYIKNEVTVVDPLYRGTINSGKSVELSGDGHVDVPINATLGSETFNTCAIVNNSGNFTMVDNGDGSYQFVDTGSNKYDVIRLQPSEDLLGKPIHIEFDCSIANGSVTMRGAFDGNGNFIEEPFDIVDGHNILPSYVGAYSSTNIYLYCADAQVFDITISNIIVKEIQDVQGQITYYDFTQKKHVSIGENGTELVENGDFSDGLNGWLSSKPEISVINEELVFTDAPHGASARNNGGTFLKAGRVGKLTFDTIATDGNKTTIYAKTADGSFAIIPIEGTGKYYTPVGLNEFDIFNNSTHNDLHIELQADGTQNTTFDNVSVIETLPLSTHYRLENVEFNMLAVLWDRSFTQDDRDMMDNDPELLLRWAKYDDVGFSVGVRTSADKCYAVMED